MAAVLRTLRDSFSPLRLPNFRLYIGGQMVSLVGTWLQGTAQAWLVWELTRSEQASGIVVMLNTLPILILSPWAGVWAERLDRRKLLIACQAGAMLLAFALAFLVQTQLVQIWHVYLLSLLLGVVNVFDLPAQQTFLGDLSGVGEVRRAVNLNAMVLQISRLIGPAFAGFLVGRLGLAPAFWINGLSFLAVIASLLAVRAQQQQRPAGGPARPVREIAEAFNYLRTQPRLQDIYIFSTMAVLLVLSIILSQLPAVADKLLGGGPDTLGILQSASGAGALLAVLLVTPLAQTAKRSGLIFIGAAIWMGVWLILFSFSRSLPLSAFCLMMGSMGAPTTIANALGLIQVLSPVMMRARLLSLFTMISFGLQTVAVFLVGFLAERLGVATVIEINGLLMIVGGLAMYALRGDLRRWQMAASAAPAAVAEPSSHIS